MKQTIREIKVNQVRIKDQFWFPKQKLVMEVMIPYQEKALNDEMEGAEKRYKKLARFFIDERGKEAEFTLAIHIPEHAKEVKVLLNGTLQNRNIKKGYHYMMRVWLLEI